MTKDSIRILSNSAMLIVAELFRKTIRMFLVIFSARWLGDVGYGEFSYALAFVTLFWVFADMGIHLLVVREVARKPGLVKKYLGTALVLKLFLSILTLHLIFIIIQFVHKPADVLITVYILAVMVILMSFTDLFKSVFHAFQQMKYDAISIIIESIVITSLGIGVLLLGGGIIGLAFVYLFTFILNVSYCIVITARKFTPISLNVDWRLMKFLLREGLPIGINHFFSTMYTVVDTLMLSLMVNDQVVGWYNAAYRLIFAMQFISMGIIKAVYPALSKYYKVSMDKFKDLFRKTFKVMLLIGFSLASLVSLLSEKIILLLYGEEYRNSAIALRILVWAMALIFVTLVMAHTTRSSDRQRFTAKVVGFCAFFNLGLNFILIPKYSYIGAAYATLATEGVSFLSHLIYLRIHIVRPPILRLLPKILAINLIMGVFIVRFMQMNIFPLSAIAILINLTMVVVVRYFSKEEFDVFMEAGRALSRGLFERKKM